MTTQNNAKIEKEDLLYPELSYEIVGAVFDVWKELGPAFKESVYQKALAKAFQERGIEFEGQKHIAIRFKGERVGSYIPDFLVADKVLIEIKYLPRLTFREKRQAWHYLKGSDYRLLLLVNFGGKEVEIKRWVYDKARKNA